jgi:hypothetical protein
MSTFSFDYGATILYHLYHREKLSMRKLLLIAVMLCAMSTRVRADDVTHPKLIRDGRAKMKTLLVEKVGQPHEVKRTPLFEVLPFLKLRAGDTLVKGKYWNDFGKGKGHFDNDESYFLLSHGKYYHLEAFDDNDGRVIVLVSYNSVLFDWDVTMKNATQLYENGGTAFGEPITLTSFYRLRQASRKNFATTLRDTGKIETEKPHLEGSGQTRHAIFQGLGFNWFCNTVFKYQLEVGNGIYKISRTNLIVGPRLVHKWEFEGFHGNDGIAYDPKSQEPAKARAAYKRMTAFQNIVNRFLVTPLRNRDELND